MKTQLQFICPEKECGKKVEVLQEFPYDGKTFYIYSCGHFGAKEISKSTSPYENLESLKGGKPYKFQVEGMEFLEQTNGRALIADEMGLGKTIQACGYVRFQPSKRPALICVKAKLLRQWFEQIHIWGEGAIAQIVKQGHAVLPGLDYYIISLDLLRVFPMERFAAVGIKTVIIDECQHIKSENAQRTHHLRKFIADNNIENVIALSGTPFKNRLSEYFTILNILAPQYFQNREEFIRRFVHFSYDRNGKIKEMGLKNRQAFESITKHFVLRRERTDVEDQIPFVGIVRRLHYCDLDDKFAKAYESAAEDFLSLFQKIEHQHNAMSRNSELLAILQRMRHITALSKIPDMVDYANEFLMSTERKLCIFVHHQDVAQELIRQINIWLSMGAYPHCLEIKGSMKDEDLSDVISKWNKEDSYRILVASTLASGEGLNLQEKCNECVIFEHQWNAANEEQAEARFRRIGQKETNVYSTYMVAGGTIDEMLVEIKERKRAMVKSGMLSKDQTHYSESALITELGEMLERKRSGQKWKLM